MRVLIINTTERQGGPAIAAYRLTEALKSNGIKAKMLVREKETDKVTTVAADKTWAVRRGLFMERLILNLHNRLGRQHRYRLDLGTAGGDITNLPEFRQADIIHLHWINDGMISLHMLQRILDSGKPVVWTLHDMWPFTGICHYAHDCDNYMKHCGSCPQLNSSREKDLAYRYFNKKQTLLQHRSIRFIACSGWLREMARKSSLLRGMEITCIPNAVDTRMFHRRDRLMARRELHLPADKRLVLFSSESVADRRKGFNYLADALGELASVHPEWKEQLGLVVLGRDSEKVTFSEIPFPVYPMQYVSDEKQMAMVYNAVDLYAIPSVQDNLPNTVVEAMACGIPCIGFNVGGIPEMIDHLHNGYIADYKNSSNFAEGIHWLLTEGDYAMLSNEALRKAQTTYSETSVADAHIAVYNQLTGKNE
ncbi:MAG: glycosyltransferase family 4 protein [Bacteroidaceae bacterium]|nr:glycosyltransferase family 4 protein [Bacteroidaceae bacterium]